MTATAGALSIIPGEKMVFTMDTGLSVEILQGDLTKESTEAIVNPTSRRMVHNFGVSMAISAAAGRKVTVS